MWNNVHRVCYPLYFLADCCPMGNSHKYVYETLTIVICIFKAYV